MIPIHCPNCQEMTDSRVCKVCGNDLYPPLPEIKPLTNVEKEPSDSEMLHWAIAHLEDFRDISLYYFDDDNDIPRVKKAIHEAMKSNQKV